MKLLEQLKRKECAGVDKRCLMYGNYKLEKEERPVIGRWSKGKGETRTVFPSHPPYDLNYSDLQESFTLSLSLLSLPCRYPHLFFFFFCLPLVLFTL